MLESRYPIDPEGWVNYMSEARLGLAGLAMQIVGSLMMAAAFSMPLFH
jgi:hypothetical protein